MRSQFGKSTEIKKTDVAGDDMTRKPWFPFYVDDFWGDENVQLMSYEEIGVYIRLLSLQWREGSIPADPEKIARIVRIESPALARLWPPLKPCFRKSKTDKDRLVNDKLLSIIEQQTEIHRRLSDAGRKGGRASKPGLSEALAKTKPGLGHPEAKPEPESDTTTTTTPFDSPAGSNGHEPPKTNEPVKPDQQPPQKTSPTGSKPKAKVKKTKTQPYPCPKDFKPTEADLSWLTKKYGNVPKEQVETQTEKFVHHHKSKGSVFVDWNSAWKNWIINWKTEFGRVEPKPVTVSSDLEKHLSDNPNLVKDDG